MKLIDGEALLSFMTDKLVALKDNYHKGWNGAVETCIDEITDALDGATEVTIDTPFSIGGTNLGYQAPSEVSVKAPESDFKVATEDNTLTALKLVKESLEECLDAERTLTYVNGMIAALEM